MPDTATTAELPRVLAPGRLFIDNEWVDAASGKTFEVVNPARAELLTEVAEGDRADVDRAVQAARRAFESDEWRRMTPRKRARVLLQIARIMEERKDEFARVET
ncbi:MAG: aldehyde dehydrogenase family protein, partial [Gemmatimonadota bacterium]